MKESLVKDKLYTLCKSFVEKHKIRSHKGLYEDEDARDEFIEYICEICKLIGYYDEP